MAFMRLASLSTMLLSAGLLFSGAARANESAQAGKHHIQTVFIILMENHNWTGDGKRDIEGNPAAP